MATWRISSVFGYRNDDIFVDQNKPVDGFLVYDLSMPTHAPVVMPDLPEGDYSPEGFDPTVGWVVTRNGEHFALAPSLQMAKEISRTMVLKEAKDLDDQPLGEKRVIGQVEIMGAVFISTEVLNDGLRH